MKKPDVFFSVVMILLILGVSTELTYLSADQNVLQQKCTKCHALKIPDNYTKKEWKYNVERMAKRAGLTSGEIQSIIDLNKKK
jgi:hypothetical protein